MLIGVLLPWHGAITVFLPSIFRYWKEGILFGLLLTGLFGCFHQKGLTFFRLLLKKKMVLWSSLFLFWLGVLVIIDQNYYSLIAARYLGFGFLVFLIMNLWWEVYPKQIKPLLNDFSGVFIGSMLATVLFGIWAKFGGGFEILSQVYSTTISSWVPGQVMPLYHQTADGFIRMQGGASGPVEFGYMLFVALFLLLKPILLTSFSWTNDRSLWLRFFMLGGLLFGLVQSGSRAALGGGLLLILGGIIIAIIRHENIHTIKKIAPQMLRLVKWLLLTIIIVGLVKWLAFSLLPSSDTVDESEGFAIMRMSDSAHITRPLEALKVGLTHPVMGDLASYGPAARMKNLNENNNDQAPIAENVFIDYFVQMGLLGSLLALLFWGSLLKSLKGFDRLFIGVSFLVINMATVFDMTPLAILFFIVFSFLSKSMGKN